MSHENYKEMIPARALSALDDADDRVLTEHLAECAECRRELDEWQETCSGLALSADPVEPSHQLRERVLSQIRGDSTNTPSSKLIPFPPSGKNIRTSFGSLAAIAATVLFVALLVYVVIVWRENRANQVEIARLNAEIEKTRQDLQEKQKALILISSPGSRMAELTPTAMAPGAIAKIAYDKTGHAMLMAQGLPAAPAGKEYQLWFIVADKPPMPGKSFAINRGGDGVMEDQVPAVAMNSAVFAITLEPKGGVPSPTGQIYLRSGS